MAQNLLFISCRTNSLIQEVDGGHPSSGFWAQVGFANRQTLSTGRKYYASITGLVLNSNQVPNRFVFPVLSRWARFIRRLPQVELHPMVGRYHGRVFTFPTQYSYSGCTRFGYVSIFFKRCIILTAHPGDRGTGASAIYPLLGCSTHPDWVFSATGSSAPTFKRQSECSEPFGRDRRYIDGVRSKERSDERTAR